MDRGRRGVISIHIYALRQEIDEETFLRNVTGYLKERFGGLKGLRGLKVLRGLRGRYRDHFAILWVYESYEAWRELWGEPDKPRPPEEYPDEWKSWEAFLANYLDRDPDKIEYTAFIEVEEVEFGGGQKPQGRRP